MIAMAKNVEVSLIIGIVSGAVAWVVTAAARYHLYKLAKMSSEASSSLSTTTESQENSNE